MKRVEIYLNRTLNRNRGAATKTLDEALGEIGLSIRQLMGRTISNGGGMNWFNTGHCPYAFITDDVTARQAVASINRYEGYGAKAIPTTDKLS